MTTLKICHPEQVLSAGPGAGSKRHVRTLAQAPGQSWGPT